MAKKMKANEILNMHSKEFAYKQIIIKVSDGREFEVQIQQKLNDTKIMGLISDLVERSDYCTKNNIEFNEVLHTYVLLIKYFTDIKFNAYKSIEKQLSHDLQVTNALIDIGGFKQIISHFDKETMEKIQDSMGIYAKQLNQVSNNKLKEILTNEYQAEVEMENEEEL